MAGLKFRRQFPIGPFIADFYCPERMLVVELDGESHEKRPTEDQERTAYFSSHGIYVFRVANVDVFADLESVAHGILRAVGVDVAAWLAERERQSREEKPPSP